MLLGEYILQSRSDATGALRGGRGCSRSCGSHSISILRLLAVDRRHLTVRVAGRGREVVRSSGERKRARCGKGLGLRRVRRMRLNTLHDEGRLLHKARACDDCRADLSDKHISTWVLNHSM